MIEKYIVMSGPDKGRIHDDDISWELAHAEYDWRKENADQPSLEANEQPGKPLVSFKDIINDELKRLVTEKIIEEIAIEFDDIENSLNGPKVNMIKSEVDLANDKEALRKQRNAELKVASEAIVKQLVTDFVELMIQNDVAGLSFTDQEDNTRTAWVYTEYSPEYPARGESSGFSRVIGIAFLETGDILEFYDFPADDTIPTDSGRINNTVFDFFYTGTPTNKYPEPSEKNYQPFEVNGHRLIKEIAEKARKYLSGEITS